MNETQLRLIEESILTNLLTQGYLVGKLLVATSLVQDPLFARSVVYILSHDDEGATGVIINNAIKDISYSSAYSHTHILHAKQHNEPIYSGGPIDRSHGFILHTDDAPYGSITIDTGTEILKEIADGKGPRKTLFALGYAEWSAGQLEEEVQENSWVVVPATERLIFDTADAKKWSEAFKYAGIDMTRLHNTAGNA